MPSSSIYVGNSSIVQVASLTDRDGAAVTTATVQMTALVDRRGATVTGITLPLNLVHVDAGTYEGEIPSTVAVQAGNTYKATIRAVAAGVTAEWEETLTAQVRQA